MAIAPEILARLKDITGPGGWVSDPGALAPYLSEPRGRFHGQSPFLMLPASSAQVSAIVAECAGHQIPIVPQGGNTGLVGGQVPSPSVNDQIIVNLGRMNRIRDINPVAGTITAEAGCILADVQTTAIAVDRIFPLSLAAEESCQIGGNLATNAGGTQVLRYGTARALTLGLEVVLADGKIWDGLKPLHKDNTGYDLKHMFIGSEGTLGIITAAVLRLFPQPRQSVTAIAGVRSIAAAMKLMERMQSAGGERATAFELMSALAVALAIKHIDDVNNPLAAQAPWYLLMEFHGGAGDDLEPAIEAGLGQALDDGEVIDGAIAQNAGQAQAMWRLRKSIPPAQSKEGASIKTDVGVPGQRAADFVEACIAAIDEVVPGSRLVAFGHLGDGNLHMNVSQPPGMGPASYLDHWDKMTGRVHDLAMEFDGTFSAEHGIGQLKRDELKRYKPAAELEFMGRIKAAFDPQGIFNPGKIF